MHACPAFLNFELMTALTATSKSASSKMRKGAFPPSSSEICFIHVMDGNQSLLDAILVIATSINDGQADLHV